MVRILLGQGRGRAWGRLGYRSRLEVERKSSVEQLQRAAIAEP